MSYFPCLSNISSRNFHTMKVISSPFRRLRGRAGSGRASRRCFMTQDRARDAVGRPGIGWSGFANCSGTGWFDGQGTTSKNTRVLLLLLPPLLRLPIPVPFKTRAENVNNFPEPGTASQPSASSAVAVIRSGGLGTAVERARE